MAKRRRMDPNRFQQQDAQGLFSLDPIRRNLLKWGLIAGAAGGIFMIQQQVVWQIIGVFTAVFISNYHISRAARHIPRWHAAVLSFIGMAVAMFAVLIAGSAIMAAYMVEGG